MTAGVGFITFLLVTLALLGGVVVTGKAAWRSRHLTLVVFTVASLGVTIYYAEQLGKQYDLPSAGWLYPFHLAVAKTAVALYLLPVVTGIATLRNAAARKWHGRVAFAVLAFTVATAVSGIAMLLSATKLEA